MQKHPNMFDYVSSSSEVYKAFQEHYDRDGRVISFLDLAFVVVVLVASYMGWWNSPAVWLIAAGLVGSRLCVFIDNSNRNWAMHVIDWMEASKQDTRFDHDA